MEGRMKGLKILVWTTCAICYLFLAKVYTQAVVKTARE